MNRADANSPVYSLILGTRTYIILSSTDAVKDLLDKRSNIYSSRPDMYMGQDVASGGLRLVTMVSQKAELPDVRIHLPGLLELPHFFGKEAVFWHVSTSPAGIDHHFRLFHSMAVLIEYRNMVHFGDCSTE